MKTEDIISKLKEALSLEDPLDTVVGVRDVVKELEAHLVRGPASLEFGSRSEERRVTAQREIKGLVPEVGVGETRTLNDVKGGMKL